MQKTENFEKNLKVMTGTKYKELKEKLEAIKVPRKFNYEFSSDKDPLKTNIIRLKDKKRLYNEPLKELEEKIEPFKSEFSRYPSLFFYGMGNGILYKVLLQNENFKKIIVYEKEIELIYLAFNLIDFSEALKTARLIIIDANDYTYAKANFIFRMPNIELFFKVYSLHIHSPFYQEYYREDIREVNAFNMEAMKSIALMHGNDPADALQGIEQATLNLPFMLTHPTMNTFLKKRKVKGGSAIIVATGPSLKKQIPLLKKVQNNATIFCADSSYEILHKYGVKPDYVLSLERAELTSEFFNNDFGEYDKDIIFIFFSLTHPNTIKYMQRNKRNYILTQRSLPYTRYLNLYSYGFYGGGMSVTNMAYEIATGMGFKNLVLIGQDLAYGKSGESHIKEYKHPYLHDGDYERHKGKFQTTAYGGEGMAESSEVWTLFRQVFENYIEMNNDVIKTYNCTEGGARIAGSIEIPFKQACKEFFNKPIKKPFAKVPKPSRKEQNENMLQAYTKIKKGLKSAEGFIKKCKKVQKQIEALTRGKQNQTIESINNAIDSIKERIENKKSLFTNEILSPPLYHQESQLTPLYVQNISNEGEKQNKLMAWIFSHEAWLEEIIDLCSVLIMRLKYDIIPLQDLLEKRKLL